MSRRPWSTRCFFTSNAMRTAWAGGQGAAGIKGCVGIRCTVVCHCSQQQPLLNIRSIVHSAAVYGDRASQPPTLCCGSVMTVSTRLSRKRDRM